MGNYAIVEAGIVTNIIVWDGNVDEWQPPEGSLAVLIPDGEAVGIGYAYDGKAFTAP